MNDAASFSHLVPGFDFLKNLTKNVGMSMPSIGQWVAPTLDPEELEKRIEELRTVQFWLEQNAKMLGATIQALEVQRMTLSTLKTMNVQMNDLRESLSVAKLVPEAKPEKKKADDKKPDEGIAGIVDPMQWWGALTQQFTQLASAAIKEGAANVSTAAAAAGTPASGSSSAASNARSSPSRSTRKASSSSKTKAKTVSASTRSTARRGPSKS